MQHHVTRARQRLHRHPGLLLVALLAACGGSSSSGTEVIGGLAVFESRTAAFASPAGTPLAVGDALFAYLAQEGASGSGGTDLNGDLDTNDQVAVVFDLSSRDATTLRAAERVFVIDDEVFLTTLELEDGVDWSTDGVQDDLVLLHWTGTGSTCELVDVLRREETAEIEDRLYYSSVEPAAPAGLETHLHWVSASAPTTPVMVVAVDAAVARDPAILQADEGLLFLSQDEAREEPDRDLNGDLDDDDQAVLALLDGIDPAAPIHSVGLALVGSAPALRARPRGSDDWLVAFLVGELEQGNQNLNDPQDFDPSWQPAQCAGLEDNDTQDEVLFYLEFADWSSDALMHPPVGTGLVGDRRVFASVSETSARAFVGTLSAEADEGDCSLNGDSDQDDDVVRWVEVLSGGTFDVPGDADDYLAIATVPGGVRGIVEVDDRWVAVVSEADDDRDHDGRSSTDYDILAWLDPAQLATRTWTFPEDPDEETALGADWMARDESGQGFHFALLEEVRGIPCNDDDTDEDDSFALFGRFNPSNANDLQWNGYCYAVEPFNAGLVVVENTAFLRVDEDEQGRDLNEDGDRQDQVLLCHTVFPIGPLRHVGTLNDLAGPAVMLGDGDTVVYLADEAMAQSDINKDGDELDLVVRYVRAH